MKKKKPYKITEEMKLLIFKENPDLHMYYILGSSLRCLTNDKMIEGMECDDINKQILKDDLIGSILIGKLSETLLESLVKSVNKLTNTELYKKNNPNK